MTILKKRNIGKTIFRLALVEVDGGFDLMAFSDNWCSGHLKAQYGWNKDEILNWFNTEDLAEEVTAAWEAHGERQLGC